MNYQEAQAKFREHLPRFQQLGVSWAWGVTPPTAYLPDEFRYDEDLAMDAQPGIVTTANAGIPAIFTTFVDPKVYEVLFAKNQAAKIIGEERKGSWTDLTALFPLVEHAGEVSSYADFSEDGNATANVNWPNRQNYLFQTMKQYGELELDMAGKARLNWISEIDASAATQLNKFQNLTYFYGVGQLQNFGLINDPGLTAFITPAPKAFGNSLWVTNNVVTATANEVYLDIQTMFIALVNQSQGLINEDTSVVVGLPPAIRQAFRAVNSFNVNVTALLKDNYPNIRIEDAVQYGVVSTSNPQGNSLGGNIVQMIAEMVEGQKTGFAAYSEKMRTHKIIPGVSSYKQKVTCGTWGTILRQTFSMVQMIGV